MSENIQLYSLATPNGQKIGIALEEMELPYDAHRIDITKGDQFKPEFVAINPNSKIPAIIDPTGNNGKPLSIFESGAILVHLAEKSGKFFPTEAKSRSETLQWLFFQMAGVGPMFGQFGHFFKFAKDKCEHPYPLERYGTETKRLLKVIDTQLKDNEYLAGGELTIADFATAPWVGVLERFYKGGDYLGLSSFENISRWMDAIWSRPKVKIGAKVCS